MGFTIDDKAGTMRILHALENAKRSHSDSLEKLSSGQVFTSQDPRPSERALAEGLEFKLRSLSASKRNINDAVSLLQTAEGGFSEISNMLVRMKEINIAAASTTLSDQERKYLFVEYNALHNEIDRIATTAEFNGIPLLNGGDERVPERLILRVGDPMKGDDAPGDGDWNELNFDNLKSVVTTTAGLGLKSVRDLLTQDDGISVDDAKDLMEAEDGRYGSVYDEAIDKLSGFRASYGAMQTRLDRARSYNEVAFENIAAAKSKIADVDYAEEVSKLTSKNILMQTATSLLTQNNLASHITVGLINSLLT